MSENEKDIKFVTIELSRKQVDVEHPVYNEKTNQNYLRVFAPGGGTYLYPSKSIKVKKDNPERVYFSRPEGTEFQVQYSRLKEGVPEGAPNSERYENSTRTIKIEDLKAMYDEERKSYAESHGFVNMSVPTEWGKQFSSDGKNYVSIAIPIPEGEKDVYYSFILQANRFKESEKEPGTSYFGFPKKQKDDINADYMISMKSNVRQEDGSYENQFMDITSTELKKYVDEAKERNKVSNLFVGTEISSKLIRNFESREGKPLAAIAVPVYENESSEKAVFYEIVVPAERIRGSEHEGMSNLSLFKNGPDGEAYNFNAKKRVQDDKGEYQDVVMKMTSSEVIRHFELSAQRYRETHQNGESDHSLADEMGEAHPEKMHEQNAGETQQNNTYHRHRGR